MSKRKFAVIGLAIAVFAFISTIRSVPSGAYSSQDGQPSSWKKFSEEPEFVSRIENGKITCQSKTGQLSDVRAESSSGLQAESSPRQLLTVEGTGNLTMILRMGAGMQANQQAQEAYMKAVQRLCSVIDAPAPVTIITDVDFKPTVAGSPNILGQSNPQMLIGRGEYSDWRRAVIANANSGKEMAAFAALPENEVPTDLGDTDTFVMPSTLLRVVGLIPPDADPEGERAQFGPPPSITFLETPLWDFNPDDGIAFGKIDFIGTALHELGHQFGFVTRVGVTELDPNALLAVSAFDIYRFRSGTTIETLATSNRILSAGGEHFHFAGEKEIPLSTARLNLMGGDGFSGDHWKDDGTTGLRLGIMDPQPQFGEKIAITNNDLIGFKAMGYRVVEEASDHTPYIGRLKGDLQGDSLSLTGAVYDIDSDVASARISLLDGSGNTLREDAPIAFDSGEKASDFRFDLTGLDAVPFAIQARVLFTDNAGNTASAIAGFGLADKGGPTINSASFNGSRLLIKGKGLSGQLEVEINGSVVATKNNGSNKKAKIKGKMDQLNIRDGANRLRVIRNDTRSNIAIMVDGATLPENKVEFVTTLTQRNQ